MCCLSIRVLVRSDNYVMLNGAWDCVDCAGRWRDDVETGRAIGKSSLTGQSQEAAQANSALVLGKRKCPNIFMGAAEKLNYLNGLMTSVTYSAF